MLLTSLEGSALREGIPAWIAIWTPNITFAIIGLTLLVATAREWRAPRLTFAWRALDALRPLMPGTRASTGTARVGHGATDSTHSLGRYRVSAPVLLMGLSVAVSAMLFQELFLPRLNELGEEVDRVKIRGQLPRHLQSRQRLWLRSADSRFYRVELLSPGTSDLYGVTILEMDRQFRLLNRLDARQAHWTDSGWELRDGAFREIEPAGTVQTVPFTFTALELSEDIEEFTRIHEDFESMSYWELREYVTRLEAAGFQAKKYLVALYSKLSFPLVNLVMVLVAIPLALQSPRGGRLFGVGLAIAIMAGYLVVHYVALAFARADLLPAFVAAWTANVIFFGIGTSLFLRART